MLQGKSKTTVIKTQTVSHMHAKFDEIRLFLLVITIVQTFTKWLDITAIINICYGMYRKAFVFKEKKNLKKFINSSKFHHFGILKKTSLDA